MLLLVSGAVGVGKSTARRYAAPLLEADGVPVDVVGLGQLRPLPAAPTVAWRQEVVDLACRRAVELEAKRRHLLLIGDPVPLGEVLAAPSANGLEVAGLLLDAASDVHRQRLEDSGEDREMWVAHVAFADWLRHHATDPTYLPEVVTHDGWPEMQWRRWAGRSDLATSGTWAMSALDTSDLDAPDVGDEVAAWCRAALHNKAPVFRAGWHWV